MHIVIRSKFLGRIYICLLVAFFIAGTYILVFSYKTEAFSSYLQLSTQSCGRIPTVCAHGGNSENAPKNSMAAFDSIEESGADCVEMDVMLTHDSQLIVSNPTDLAKIMSVSLPSVHAQELNYTDLGQLDAGSYFHPRFSSERIPLLENVLPSLTRRLPLIVLDLKEPPCSHVIGPLDEVCSAYLEELAVKTVQLVAMNCQEQQCVVWSKCMQLIQIVHRISDEHIPVGQIYPQNHADIATFMAELGTPGTDYQVLGFYFTLIDDALSYVGHTVGLYAYTVDDTLIAQKLAADCVDVIVSNKPKSIVEALSPFKVSAH